MAVQWLSHRTGLAALFGCSGGLEKEKKKKRERERRIKETTEEESRILEKRVKVGMRKVSRERDQRSNR